MKRYLIILFLIFGLSYSSGSQDTLIFKKKQLIQLNQSTEEIRKDLIEIKKILAAQESSKDKSALFTIVIAFFAVIVSCISGYLNYKAFRGQSISNYRKKWNDSVIDSLSEFIVIASNIYNSVKKGIMPTNYEAEIVNLNKFNNIISFKLKEMGFGDQEAIHIMPTIIELIITTKKDTNSSKNEDFVNLITNLSKDFSQILQNNWKTIKKFE